MGKYYYSKNFETTCQKYRIYFICFHIKNEDTYLLSGKYPRIIIPIR